jgi:hypothetical protein
MSFKENLLKKIRIDKLVDHIISTIGPVDSDKKVDKQAMRTLVEMAPYEMRKERDLELYIKLNGPEEKKRILVLDNDLSIYHTNPEDVALRKSPTVKEMISIRNIIKILNDGDVVKSKKEESVKIIQKECVQQLNLDYAESDIDQIKNDGKAALDWDDKEGVIESLELFAELLDLAPPSKVFKLDNFKMFGKLNEGEKGEIFYGPIILYSLIKNELKLIEKKIGSYDKAGIEMLHQIAKGNEKASKEKFEVFDYLKTAVSQKQKRYT